MEEMGYWNGNCEGYPSCLAKHKDARKNCPRENNPSTPTNVIKSIPSPIPKHVRQVVNMSRSDDWENDITNISTSKRTRNPSKKKRAMIDEENGKKPAQGRTRAATRSMTDDSKEENYSECGLERNGDKGKGDKIMINGLKNTATTKDNNVQRVRTDESQVISENHLVIRDVDSNTVVEEDSPDIIMNDTSPKVEVEKNYLIKVANGLVQADRKVKSLEKELDDAKKKISSQYSDLVKQQDKIALLSDEVKRLEGKEEIKALIQEVNRNKQRNVYGKKKNPH